MTPQEKWQQIRELQARIRQIDVERETLVRKVNGLLMIGAARHGYKRLTWADAEKRAREIHELRGQGISQREIAAMLQTSPSSVAAYLSPRCKARARAGIAA